MLRLKALLSYRFGYLSLLIAVSISFIGGNYFYAREHASRPNPELVALRAANITLQKSLTQSDFDLRLERETIKEMNDTVLRVQSDLIEQQLALRFYQKIMAPELTSNGVHVENVIIEAGISERHYRFELILAQLEKRKSHLKGKAYLTLIGSENGKPTSIDMASLTASKKELILSFRYFQQLKNDFILPPNFTPERLTVTIKMPKRRGQKASDNVKEFSWNELLKVPLKPMLSR